MGTACRPPADLGLPFINWSVRSLALHLMREDVITEIHYSSVCLILQEAELKPHRTLYWKRSHDPLFREKALHVLWYYEMAHSLWQRGELVFCVDEKPGIQLLGRPLPDLPLRPGCPLRREHEYIRHGTGLLLMVHDLNDGGFFCRTPVKKCGRSFTRTLDSHLATVPGARRIHYIMDNDGTHGSQHTREWLASKKGRVRFHYTPTGASWLNQAEIALSVFSRKYLKNRVWSSKLDFSDHVQSSVRHYNRFEALPFSWSFTRNRFREWNRSMTSSTRH